MIITKSISRFARNTLDCLKYVRMLKELNVDVYFEEQGIHSIEKGSEFYITIYGSLAQSESENISENVKWGKEQSAKDGKVPFRYKNTLGYRKGADGNPEIVSEEAETIRWIYESFLSGDSVRTIKENLESKEILSPVGNKEWSPSTILGILTNVRYKGDLIVNKTYVVDCITKKIKKNNGERNKYYIENHHPAIIDALTFGKVQEEFARRNSKSKIRKNCKTELGKYNSKYALSELLICGECNTPYQRCTWTSHGKRRIVWRCINRVENGTKYCHDSPTIDESVIQYAIMSAVKSVAMRNTNLLNILRTQIAANLACEDSENRTLEIKVRLAEIDTEYRNILSTIPSDLDNYSVTENQLTDLMLEKRALEQELDQSDSVGQSEAKLSDITSITQLLINQPLQFDNALIRQILECVVVLSKEKIKVVFKDGTEVEQKLSY